MTPTRYGLLVVNTDTEVQSSLAVHPEGDWVKYDDIVRCVNERAELLKALKDIADLCDTPPSNRPLAIDVVCSRLARQALAQAEKGTI